MCVLCVYVGEGGWWICARGEGVCVCCYSRTWPVGQTGNTALHYAAQAGDVEIVEFLCSHGASVFTMNKVRCCRRTVRSRDAVGECFTARYVVPRRGSSARHGVANFPLFQRAPPPSMRLVTHLLTTELR